LDSMIYDYKELFKSMQAKRYDFFKMIRGREFTKRWLGFEIITAVCG